jgi:hypothetical protein
MDVLVAVILVGLAVWFIFRVLRGVLPPRWLQRIGLGKMRIVPRKVTEKCSVCKDVLNPAEVSALRQGRRNCPEKARCPYQRSKWLN